MGTEMRMQLLGKFCLENDRARLDENSLHSVKLTKLLVYLIVNRDQVLSRKNLMETFWTDDSKNPAGALKNLMYRLREALKVFGDDEFVCTLPGAYQWNPDIPVRTDYEHFVELSDSIRAEADTEQIKALCREAIRCFNGNVSAKISSEPWILSKVTWYQSLYMNIVKTLGEILEKGNNWEVLRQCGEWELDISQLFSKLDEGQRPEGVFFCDYQAFRQIYRMEARRIERSGIPEYIVLVTVCPSEDISKEPADDYSLLEAIDILRKQLGSDLRMGDVAARYSMTQFILLLPMCSMEACEAVMERIKKKFMKKIGKRHLELVYEMEEVSAAMPTKE